MIEVNFIRNFSSTLFKFKNVAKWGDKVKREKFFIKKDPGRGVAKLEKFQQKKEKEQEKVFKSTKKLFEK